MYLIFDIETLNNFCCVCILDVNTLTKKVFRIHDGYNINELAELVEFCKKTKNHKYQWVGYNNLDFDAQILEYIFDNYLTITAHDIYLKAIEIIELEDEDKFKKLIPEYKLRLSHRDIYKIKHYNSEVKRTSLKWLEFTFRNKNVLEMPIHFTTIINEEQAQIVIDYCWNDIETTYKAFIEFKDEIVSREITSEKYNINVLNASEPKTVEKVYQKVIGDKLNIGYTEWKKRIVDYKKNLKPFTLKDKFSKYLEFTIPQFQNVKNVFDNLLLSDKTLEEEIKHEKSKKFTTNLFGEEEEIKSKKPKKIKNQILSLKYNYKNIEFVHGVGGLHACIKPGVYESDNELIIIDLDFSSYYPHLGFNNNIFPPYLGEIFIETWKSFYTERLNYPKSNPLNAMFKLFLNGTFGKLKEKNGLIYYVEGFYLITLSGQLILLYLIDLIEQTLGKDFQVLQCNTDGITVKIKRSDLELLDNVISKIQDTVNINMEKVVYDRMIIGDVNNYTAITTEGKVKLKGMFDYNVEKHKNPSYSIIPKAIVEYFVKGTDVRTYIQNHNNIYDFLGAVKKKRNFELVLYEVNNGKLNTEILQRVTRFFVSKKSSSILKEYNDGRKSRINARCNVEVLNNIISENVKDYRINYNFYIEEANKIINLIENS